MTIPNLSDAALLSHATPQHARAGRSMPPLLRRLRKVRLA
jgi:hypothetical protein